MNLHKKVFILVGVGPLNSARSAQWIREHVPGVHIPDAVIKRMAGAQDQQAEGSRLCMELVQQIHDTEGVAGVHIMAYRQEEAVARIIDESGVLAGRKP